MIGLIIEGTSDMKKIQMALRDNSSLINFVLLNGVHFGLSERTSIKEALVDCTEVYILTDPDTAGNAVAEKIKQAFPQTIRIVVDPNKAKVLKKRGYKYGVEYCSNQYIKSLISNHIK